MKSRLSYKFFLWILAYSLLIVGLMVGIVQFFALRNFSEYVNRMELAQLDGLVRSLADFHQQEHGWEPLRENPRDFKDILRQAFPDEQARPRPGKPPPGKRKPPPRRDFNERGRDRDRPPPPRERQRRPPENRGPRPAEKIPAELSRRLSLFDENKGLVFGNPHLSDQVLRPIKQNGRILGWLGIRKQENLVHPLDREFLKQQAKAFYLIGAVALILGALLALILARLLVRPVRTLKRASENLASLRFETRIKTKRKDELGQLAETFNSMARKLNQYETTRRQWLSDVAHELRTPLSVLQVEIESMQDGVKDLDDKALESLRSEVLHLGRIVRDLHELSLAESKALKMVMAPVSVARVLAKTLDKYAGTLKREQLETNVALDLIEREKIMGDADRLTQLFSNLMENALRYADRPGILEVSGKSEANRLILSFEDSGPGVPADALPRLFDRFYRADPSRNRKRGGSGLGLAICKNITEAHGGIISARKSRLGGLNVEIILPKNRPARPGG